MSSYEAKVWSGGELVPVVSWDIGMLMTRHATDCRVRDELRRSVGKYAPERRLELAREAACTCGAREHENNSAPITTSGVDRRDNRDPAEVGREHLNR